mgnify:CR=1 FL=1
MRVDKRGGISLDIYTIYEKDRRIKTGNSGPGIWDTTYSQKGPAIRPCDYGDYILQKKRRSRRK